MINEGTSFHAEGGLLELTDDELDLVLGANGPSGAQESAVITHLGHIALFVGLGSIAGHIGAGVGLAVGLGYEAYEHREALGAAAQDYQNNPPPI